MKTQLTRRQHLFGIGTALAATACVSTRFEPGTDHPASAKAETAPPSSPETILASAPAPESTRAPATSGAHDHAVPQADTYTCPMHPQVIKNAPGKCPICGMNLVKKESAKPEGAAD
jgi:hypothetical protein